ncbi:Zn-ribbon domain-containing protein [Halorientalis sp.]|uniref:Zn-ribbon domain-containing protein n=1 Tax=Halorientalis sp. TaxID=1931229 RepID=UPI00261BD1BF|nr:Zn-ribbon containing protein [Halorientalis sp.]
MPHQCTSCGQVFDDGSKEMLSGCPDCGGNKFQFHASTEDVPEGPEPSAEPPDQPAPDSSVARTVGDAAATVRDLVGGSGRSQSADALDDDPSGQDTAPAGSVPSESAPAPDSPEDAAQADARSEVVSPDEIPAGTDTPPTDETPMTEDSATDPTSGSAPTDSPADASDPDTGEPSEDRPDLSELREELNDQFESIKVLSPGQYELNLMELYDREEYIIALQEDGRYTIQVPENWHD